MATVSSVEPSPTAPKSLTLTRSPSLATSPRLTPPVMGGTYCAASMALLIGLSGQRGADQHRPDDGRLLPPALGYFKLEVPEPGGDRLRKVQKGAIDLTIQADVQNGDRAGACAQF